MEHYNDSFTCDQLPSTNMPIVANMQCVVMLQTEPSEKWSVCGHVLTLLCVGGTVREAGSFLLHIVLGMDHVA